MASYAAKHSRKSPDSADVGSSYEPDKPSRAKAAVAIGTLVGALAGTVIIAGLTTSPDKVDIHPIVQDRVPRHEQEPTETVLQAHDGQLRTTP